MKKNIASKLYHIIEECNDLVYWAVGEAKDKRIDISDLYFENCPEAKFLKVSKENILPEIQIIDEDGEIYEMIRFFDENSSIQFSVEEICDLMRYLEEEINNSKKDKFLNKS